MGETKVCEWTRTELCDRPDAHPMVADPIEKCIACMLAKLLAKTEVKA